jgi:predicted GNAT family acetyltransferase
MAGCGLRAATGAAEQPAKECADLFEHRDILAHGYHSRMPAVLLFVHDETRRRYGAEIDGLEVAFSEVDPIGTDSMLIKHTEVLAAHEGKGYGSSLVRHILDAARDRGMTVVPICPFTADYIRRHPEYLDVVKESFRAAMR